MIHRLLFAGCLIFWVGTILLLLPCIGVSCAFGLWSMNSSRMLRLLFQTPGNDLLLILSYPISVAIVLLASWIVALSAVDHVRAIKHILLVDAIILWIATGFWGSGPQFLPR